MDLQDMGLMDAVAFGLKLGVVLAVAWVLLWGLLHLSMWMAVVVQSFSALGGRLLGWLVKTVGRVWRGGEG